MNKRQAARIELDAASIDYMNYWRAKRTKVVAITPAHGYLRRMTSEEKKVLEVKFKRMEEAKTVWGKLK